VQHYVKNACQRLVADDCVGEAVKYRDLLRQVIADRGELRVQQQQVYSLFGILAHGQRRDKGVVLGHPFSVGELFFAPVSYVLELGVSHDPAETLELLDTEVFGVQSPHCANNIVDTGFAKLLEHKANLHRLVAV